MISLRMRARQYSVERRLAKAMLLLGLCAALTQLAIAQAPPNLEQQLEQELKGKVLLLRGFPDDRKIEYSSDGNVISKIRTGSWTTSKIRIDRVKTKQDHLVISGERVALYYAKSGIHHKDADSKIELDIAPPFSTLNPEEREKALDRIFIRHDEDLIKEVPAYWVPFLSGKVFKNDHGRLAAEGWPPKDVFTAGSGIKPPSPVSTPDPQFPKLARNIKFAGTSTFQVILTAEGTIQEMTVIDPIGAGLDEAAAAALRNWKFRPAIKDGQPVASTIQVVVSFHLY